MFWPSVVAIAFTFRPWLIAFAIMALFLLAGTWLVHGIEAQTEKATGVVAPTPAAEKGEKENKLAIATQAAKQLVLTMDTNKNGKISKGEWMKFMEKVRSFGHRP